MTVLLGGQFLSQRVFCKPKVSTPNQLGVLPRLKKTKLKTKLKTKTPQPKPQYFLRYAGKCKVVKHVYTHIFCIALSLPPS